MVYDIRTLSNILKSYPEIKYELGDDFIQTKAINESGFDVRFYIENQKYCVKVADFNSIVFSDERTALDCFFTCLSNESRVRRYFKNGINYFSILEYRSDNKWNEIISINKFIFNFWDKKTVRYYQNSAITKENIIPKKDWEK